MSEPVSEFTLNDPPADGISAVKFQPNSSSLLLVSSWDTGVRLYDVNTNTKRMQYNHSAPVLDCSFHDAVHSYSVGKSFPHLWFSTYTILYVYDSLAVGNVANRAVGLLSCGVVELLQNWFSSYVSERYWLRFLKTRSFLRSVDLIVTLSWISLSMSIKWWLSISMRYIPWQV